MKKIVFITSQAFSISNFRGRMISDLVNQGYQVYAMAPDFNEITKKSVVELGAKPVDIKLSRGGFNLIDSFKSIGDIIFKLREISPDIVVAYFIKPIIFGMIASHLVGISRRYALIEGLGYAFSNVDQWRNLHKLIIRYIAIILYRVSLIGAKKVFFLNTTDLRKFIDLKMVKSTQTYLLGGIGVDLNKFTFTVANVHPVTFIMVARLIKEKGVYDYVESAKLIKNKVDDVEFILLGDIDSNPTSLTRDVINKWVSAGIIKWPGQVDVLPWLKSSSVFVLPSYYNEGVPRSIQEAMATGLPIITTDMPGCRETVISGVNGFLVPPRNPIKLAESMLYFIDNPEMIVDMGFQSRLLCEERYNEKDVNLRFFRECEIYINNK